MDIFDEGAPVENVQVGSSTTEKQSGPSTEAIEKKLKETLEAGKTASAEECASKVYESSMCTSIRHEPRAESINVLTFLLPEEVAQLLRVAPQTVRKLISSGELDVIYPNGKQAIIPISAVYHWAKKKYPKLDVF